MYLEATEQELGIECKDLSVSFSSGKILQALNMKVGKGEIVSLLGASGCGKSTLLRAIAGLVPVEQGSIQISSRKISFVFQESTLLPWRTVLQNIRLPLELGSRNLKDPRCDQINEILEQVGLSAADAKKLPSELSGGMKMRTSLARGLITDPDILLLDEPFAALDDMLRTKLNELLLSLWRKRQRTILFVTHNIAEAIFLSHRVAVLGGGKVYGWIEIDLPALRESSIRSTPNFANLYGKVAKMLEESIQ